MVREHIANDLLHLKQDFESVLHHIFQHHVPSSTSQGTTFAVIPPIETWIDTEDKEFHLSMPIPGIRPEEVNITLQGKYLTLTGDQEDEQAEKGTKNYIQREFSYKSFARTITPRRGGSGQDDAERKDGILQITAPIASTALPKKLLCQTAHQHMEVESEYY